MQPDLRAPVPVPPVAQQDLHYLRGITLTVTGLLFLRQNRSWPKGCRFMGRVGGGDGPSASCDSVPCRCEGSGAP